MFGITGWGLIGLLVFMVIFLAIVIKVLTHNPDKHRVADGMITWFAKWVFGLFEKRKSG